MGNSLNLSALLSEYEQLRHENQRKLFLREQEVREMSPSVAQHIDARRTTVVEGQRKVFAQPGKAKELAQLLTDDIRRINAELRAKLAVLGFSEDYLQPIYNCPACRDTGYVGEPVRELCICIRKRLMEAANQGEWKGGLGSHSFEQFDLQVFPDVPIPGSKSTQREYMGRVLRLARQYADDFPDTAKLNLLFTGQPGLGKTFLADCIASRVMERAYLVRRITAYRLVEIMRKHHFDGSEADAVKALMDSDLLFLDDLGTEPMIRNVTVNYLFQIINERNNEGRHTIISTNLGPEALIDSYGERVGSRLLDTSLTLVLRFIGKDIRLRKERNHGNGEGKNDGFSTDVQRVGCECSSRGDVPHGAGGPGQQTGEVCCGHRF